jgi:cytochrome c2
MDVVRHQMKLLSIIVIVILTFSCKNTSDAWQTLDFGTFQLQTPKGWSIIEEQGIDSYVGGLTNCKDTLSFDYGWYTAEIDETEHEKHLYAQDTINGLTAVLQIPKVDGKGSVVMFIPKVTGSNKFGIAGSNINGTDTILRIFKSIRFKQSDTTKNSLLTRLKFKEYPFGSGRTLFHSNCASCHTFNKNLTGPALKGIVNERSGEWIYKFLTYRKSVAADSSYKARLAEYQAECVEYPQLTKNDVAQIVEYIKTK